MAEFSKNLWYRSLDNYLNAIICSFVNCATLATLERLEPSLNIFQKNLSVSCESADTGTQLTLDVKFAIKSH